MVFTARGNAAGLGGAAALLLAPRGTVSFRRHENWTVPDTKIGTVPRQHRPKPSEVGHPDLDVGRPVALDTFDPKPAAGMNYCGPVGQTDPHQRGRNCDRELLPAGQAGRQVFLIRSMTHGINAHETAAYMVQTGRKPGERLSSRASAPSSRCSGQRRRLPRLIPPYVVLTELQGGSPRWDSCRRATNLPPAATRRRPASSSKASSPRASPTNSNAIAANCSID